MANGKRILIIEDAGLVRRFYREALEQAGFAVDEVLNGLEALEKLVRDEAFDLLIVDINMPQMDGITFLQKLRRMESSAASTPALMASTEAQSQDFNAARAAGANFYLPKPVGRDVLVEYAALMCGVAP